MPSCEPEDGIGCIDFAMQIGLSDICTVALLQLQWIESGGWHKIKWWAIVGSNY
ncbi:hypothetical protein JW926_07370 [Candidatus Sumerlaeota bacterium]|nr:hypothetical protein [Candidatus Sumerlaeota bacterium]